MSTLEALLHFHSEGASAVEHDLTRVGDTASRSHGKAAAAANQFANSVISGAVVVGGYSVAQAAKYQDKLTKLETQAGASSKEVDNLKNSILQVAPAYGTLPTAAADALYPIESVGLHGKAAMDALKAAMVGAQISGANLTDTANTLAAAQNSGLKDTKNANDAMAIVNTTVGHGKMTLDDYNAALKSGITPSLQSAGLGLRDFGSFLDVMTAKGVPAEQAANRLKTVLTFMSAPGKAATTALASIHMTQGQLAADMHKPNGLLTAFKDLKDHLKGLSEIQQNEVLRAIFGGARGVPTAQALLNNLPQFQQLQTAQNQSNANQLNDEWQKRQKDATFQLDKLKASLQKLGIEVGNILLPILNNVVGWLTKVIGGLDPKAAQKIVEIGGGLVGLAIGIKILSGVISTAKGVWGGLKWIGSTAGSIWNKLFGSGGSSALPKATMTVAEMTVDVMYVKTMIGGGNGLPGGKGKGEKGVPTPPGGIGGEKVPPEKVPPESKLGKLGRLGKLGKLGLGALALGGGEILGPLAGTMMVGQLLEPYIHARPMTQQQVARQNANISRILPLRSGMSPPQAAPQPAPPPHHAATPSWVAPSSQTSHDFDAMNAQLALLEQHKESPTKVAFNLNWLAKQAAKVNDTKWVFGDTLAAQMVQGQGVSSKGVQGIIGELGKMPPQARDQAELAMIQMSRGMETAGEVPKGTTQTLVTNLEGKFGGLSTNVQTAIQQMGLKVDPVFDTLKSKTDAAGTSAGQAAAAYQQFSQWVQQTAQNIKNNPVLTISPNGNPLVLPKPKAPQPGQPGFGVIPNNPTNPLSANPLGHSQGGVVRHFQAGGPTGVDNIPAWLTSGEGVVNTRGMGNLGSSGLQEINQGNPFARIMMMLQELTQTQQAQMRNLMQSTESNHLSIEPQTTVINVDGRRLAESVTHYALKRAARGASSANIGGPLIQGAQI